MIPSGTIQKRLIMHPPPRRIDRPHPSLYSLPPARWHCNAEDGPASSAAPPWRAAPGRGGRAMKCGSFYELQLPRPWEPGGELRLYQNALDQVELAGRLGYDYAWEVEHHFLEEYSHSPAPEVFLAAASQRTKRIRLAHGIMQLTTNHPARCAERIAALDLVSNGRVEFGTGESSSITELEPFGVNFDEKRAIWEEGLRAVIPMLTQDRVKLCDA